MLNLALRKKIILLFLFFGLLPLVITFFLALFQIQKSLRETVNSNLSSLANEVMNSTEKTVQSIYTDVELLSANPLIRSTEASDGEKLSEIKKIQDFYGIFEDITLIDLEGNVIISTTYKYRGEWKNKQWYQEAKQGKSSISPAHIILGPFKVILSSAAPIKDKEGKIIAVIAGQVNMETIWEITDNIKIGKNGLAFIVNRNKNSVAHPEKEKIFTSTTSPGFYEEVFSKNNGIINYINENQENMLGAFASFSEPKLIEQLGWRLVVAQPESEVFTLVSIFQRQVIIIFIGGFVLLLVISYLLGDKIVIPLKKLIIATKKVAIGKLETKIEIKTGDEIEELAKSFNQMAKDLKKSRDALINMLEDVEEAKGKAEEEKNKTLSIITNFTDGLLVFDIKNRLSLINAQSLKFFNIKSNDIINKSILELNVFPTIKPIIRLVGGEIKKIFRKEVQLTEILVLEVSTVPIMKKKEKLGNLIILHDVTREKMIEKTKSEFISVASHQLRTPLSIIKWTLRMCLDGNFGRLTQKQNNFLTQGYDSNERMINLVNDLLDVSRIEEGKLEYQFTKFDIKQLLKEALDQYKVFIKEKELIVKTNIRDVGKILINGDRKKLFLVFSNLIDNAVKFTAKKSIIDISVNKNKNMTQVTIKDSGVGMGAEDKKQLFTKFFRAESAKRVQTQGTGLGLFIVKNIIKKHKGKIKIDSILNKGTTVKCWLP